MPEVVIGKDAATGEKLTIGDVERCGGLYILGKPRTGKSTLLVSLALQDIEHGHGLLFIDPAADAINEMLVRIPKHRQQDVILLDPTDETHSFSVNVLSCANPKSLKERNITFSSAIDIFIKLFPNPQTGALDILLSKYLRNSFYPLIENQGYTLADIPLFLTDKPFRESLLKNVSFNPEVVDFWHYEFAQLPRRDQTKEIESTLNRLNPLLTRDYTKYMVSQAENTVDFARWMDTRKIVLLRMPNWLDDEMKSYIGTILISQLLKAAFLRAEDPPQERILFGLYCDEFHLFASPDFAKLFTQTGKFNLMPTVAHVERLGQLKPYDPNLGATLAAPLKVLFSQAIHDSDELAPEMAKPSPTETKFERKPAIAQYPVAELLRVQHHNPEIREFVDQYLRRVEWRQEILKEQMEAERLERADSLDQAALSRVDERREALYVSTWWGRDRPISIALGTLDRQEQAIEQSLAHTANLVILHERIRNVQQLLRYLNYWLVRVMEGRLAEGHEDFSRFIIAWVESLPFVSPKYRSVTASLDSVLKLYLSLVYGDPTIPCSIPFNLAKTQRLYTDTVTALEQEVRLAKDLFWEEASQGQHKSAKRYYHYRTAVPANLEPRSLSTDERKQVLTACHAELFSNGKAQNTHALFEVINDFVRFCKLLHQPENHIKIPGTQYVETQVNTYTTQEMTNQMAQELIDLPRFTVYAKVIQEQGGVQLVRKAKIKTEELPEVPPGRLPEASRIARQNAIDSGILRPRRAIEAESRARQARWRRRALENPPPPSEEPPPNRTHGRVSNGLPPTLEEPPPAQAMSSIEPPKHEEPPPTYSPPKNIPEKRSHVGALAMANKSSSSPYEPMPAPLPAPLPPSHPAPALETSGLQFCVTGSGATEEEIRHDYNNCFPLRLAKSVNIGLEMGNLLYKQRDQTYQVEMRYYNPDGFLMGTFERRDWIVKSDLDWAGIYTSEGIENSGSWIPGTYRVVVIIDGFEFAEGSFEIEETPPPSKDPPPIEKREPVKPTEQAEMGKASDLRIRLYGVQYLFFFESGKDCPEKELRSHRFWFPQETTRFINYEITLERIYSFRSDRTYQMVVRYYNPDGSLWRTDDPRDWVMKSDAREIVLTGGIGWEEPGRWKIGDYRIEFSINGEEFAQTKFKILKPRIKRSSNNGKTSGGKS